jgi:glucokinase
MNPPQNRMRPQSSPQSPSLLGDIGGTHARFALMMGKGCFESYMTRIPTDVIRA